MNKFYTDKETEMPDQLFDDIDKYEIWERQEIWMDDLFTRRKFYQEKK